MANNNGHQNNEATSNQNNYGVFENEMGNGVPDKRPYRKRQHTVTKPYKCTKCISRYSTADRLRLHEKIHGEKAVDMFQCTICHKSYKSSQSLIAHRNVHNDVKPFKCKFCNVRFKLRGALKEHYKIHIGLVFKCSFCGKDFNKIGNLKMHEQRHAGEQKQFKCDVCEKVFVQQCLLKYHMRTHSGDKPNKCSVCDVAFACKSNLRKHFRIHTGEKPFECDICFKVFNQKSSLTCHKRTHVTFKPHMCKYCGKPFGLNEELIVHLRIHGEIKPFKCSTCDLEFTEHSHLKSHVRMHIETSTALKTVIVCKQEVDLEDDNCYIDDFNNKDKPAEEYESQFDHNMDSCSSSENRDEFNYAIPENQTPQQKQLENIDSNNQFENVFVDINRISDADKTICNIIPKIEPKSDGEEEQFIIKPLEIVDIPIKIEKYQENSDYNSEDDDKPLIQRIDWKRRLTERFQKKAKNKKVVRLKTTEKIKKKFLQKAQKDVLDSQENTSKINAGIKLKLKVSNETSPVAGAKLYKVELDIDENTQPSSHNLTEDSNSPLSRRTQLIKPHYRESSDEDDMASTLHKKRTTSSHLSQPALHEDRKYKCPDCQNSYNHAKNLQSHQLIHLKVFICTQCSTDCGNLKGLRRHFRQNKICGKPKFQKKVHKCQICDKIFRTKEQLTYHVFGHTGEKPFKCDYCEKAFRSKEQLKNHMNIHTGLSQFKCEICGKGFCTRGHLNQHMLQHNDEKPFKCEICCNYFKSHGRLYNHQKIHREDAYKCSHCGKGFKTLGNVKIHEVRHTGGDGERFPCDVCGKAFLFKHKLKYHMRTHTGERPYACTDCEARFADISNLQKHMRIHTGIKPYKCSVCSKEFNQLSSLNSHKKSHLTFKPFKCQYCNKDFALDVDLILHLRVHGDVRMFKCSVCDKEYEQLCHMKSHRRLHFGADVKNEERNISLKDWGNIMRARREGIDIKTVNLNLPPDDWDINTCDQMKTSNIGIQGWDAIKRATEMDKDANIDSNDNSQQLVIDEMVVASATV